MIIQEDTLSYLHTRIPTGQTEKFPGEIGLKRMQDLLSRLGNPQNSFRSIHIAGTAGKGSTAMLAAKILQSAGLKVGLHTSPHLQTIRERIQIDGQIIPENEFVSLINYIRPSIEQMGKGNYGKPSYFEVLVAASFQHFKNQEVDAAVIEAGLGGRFDGTNVINSTVSIVTNVGLDHTQILGDTKEKILRDKMQIIKTSNSAAITGIVDDELYKIIESHCQKIGVPLLGVGRDFFLKNESIKPNKLNIDYSSENLNLEKLTLNSGASYQVLNAGLAITACIEFTKAEKFALNDQMIFRGLDSAKFPGRFEFVSRNPLIILDGAHNEDKISALVAAISQAYPQKKFIIIFGLKKNKKAKEILKILEPITERIIITQFSKETDMGLNLGYDSKALTDIATELLSIPITQEKDPVRALKIGQESAKKSGIPLLVTGSLYLVGEIRQQFQPKST